MRKATVIISMIIIVAMFIWLRAPIIGNEWSKQTIFVGLIDTWYGSSADDKAYAMWVDDDSTIGVFRVKRIADEVVIPPYFAVIADTM